MAIEIRNLTKIYGTQPALNDISFSVNTGEIAGFIGPNGAGKSTTMKIICGLLAPDNGVVLINREPVFETYGKPGSSIGYLPETNPLYPEMYIREYLGYVAGLYRLGKKSKTRIEETMEMTGLIPERSKKIGSLSKGYRQRVGLAQALIHDPDVLILDEPTSGLDPNQLAEIRNLIQKVGRKKTVLLSTHIMQEVEAICNRVIIINKGEIVADSLTSNLPGMENQSFQTILVEFNAPIALEKIEQIPGAGKVKNLKANTWLIQSSAEQDIRPAVFSFAVENNLVVLSVYRQEKKLEDLFRELTQ